MGHFVATSLAGLIMFTTGSYLAVLGLSMAYSLGGVVVIALLESNAQVLIPDWENELPVEAQLRPSPSRMAPPPRAVPTPAPAGGDGND